MGVSFKVAKIGTRFRPKPVQSSEAAALEDNSNGNSSFGADSTSIANHKPQADVTEAGEDAAGISGSSSCSGGQLTSPGCSFDVHVFTKAIESGRLPGDILDDIPSKYFEGVLVCEVRDFRKCGTEAGSGISMLERSPIITKVHLRMSLENVVKDIPLISDDSWTYSDLMEVESRIVKVLQPRLCLDPTPMLDRLSNDPVPTKIDLGLSSARKRRLRQIPGVTVASNNQAHGKKICIDRVSESENGRAGDFITLSGDTPTQNVFENMNGHSVPNNILPLRPRNLPEASTSSLPSLPLKYHVGNGHPKPMQDRVSVSSVSTSGVSPGGRDAVISCTDTMSSTVSSLHGKRENLDASLSPLSKRARQTSLDVDPNQQQQFGSQLENLPGADMPWNNQLLHPQSDPRGASYASVERQKYTQKVLEGAPNQDTSLSSPYLEQQAPRYGVKQERIETENDRNRSDLHPLDNESNLLDPQQSRVQQRLHQHPILRQNFPSQMQWHNLGQLMDRDRKEEHLQKRKPVQSPRVSASLGPSPAVSSKSGEFSSGSFGPQFNTVAMSTAFGSSQKEKATTISSAVAGGAPSVASSPGDSIPRQQPATTAAKRRSNSLPKTPSTSGVGSPASVGNMSVPLSASSPPVGSPCLADQAILERFSKIEMVTMRHGLNVKKNKVDDYPVHRAMGYSTELLSSHLSSASSSEDFKDSSCRWPLSKSLVGGSMNVRKIRVMDFVHGERRLQGNMVTFIPKVRRRLIMSEKQNDGTVAMRYGEPDDSDPLASEDYLPTLPTTHYADLLAAQFTALVCSFLLLWKKKKKNPLAKYCDACLSLLS
ncbi:hypothetical protein Scep_025024 [Stephania cephalantha]|uniref:Uncharacterized protein n=1 Tax=Stephania cephalantha TaxID=152367 RepID=A0AAP0HZ56_9MAGN